MTAGSSDESAVVRRSGPLLAAALLLGCGLGGFFDGIVLHQLLQWHNLLSSVRPPVDLVSMKLNMLWDGVFHVMTWLATTAGVIQLWLAARRPDLNWSAATFAGGGLLGWGAFNLVEGVLDHAILGIHHVRPGPDQLAWDLGFLVWGASMLAAGGWLVRHGQRSGVA